MDVETLVAEVARNGGTLRAYEGFYAPHDITACHMGLINVVSAGSGLDFEEVLTLTPKGRRLAGMPVETPAPRVSMKTRLLGLLGLPTRA